jgi:hypothetical protein
MPLLDAIEHVHRVADSATINDACEALKAALRDGGIKSRYHGGGLFGGDGCIDPSVWYRATVFSDGSVEFAPHWSQPPAPPGLRGLRQQVEVCRADVLHWWPAVPHPGPAEASEGDTPKPATSEAEGAPAASIDDRLAEWIFVQHSRRISQKALLTAALDAQLGEFRKADFGVAYRKVYASKAHRPPATGWPLRSPYKERPT